jgi:transcription elongation GreA/GreB family factor
MNDIKNRLFNLCMAYVDERIANATEAIAAARDSSNDDTKSSAGDKYETGRAMMQQDIDRQTLQLGEAQKLKIFLERMEPENQSETVQNGSLVYTNYGIFYLAISIGQVELDGTSYFVISGSSPIGAQLINQTPGARVSFNGRDYKIESIV